MEYRSENALVSGVLRLEGQSVLSRMSTRAATLRITCKQSERSWYDQGWGAPDKTGGGGGVTASYA